jgi:short-subunit dehydrogenase
MRRPRALVTGASAGIGAAVAGQLASEGFTLVITAEDDGIHRVAADLVARGADVTPVLADLRSPDAVERLYLKATALGALDVVVLNAGVGVGGGAFTQTPLPDHLDVIDLNVRSTVQLAGLVLPDLVARGAGRMLITSSLVTTMAGPYQATYNASKAFLTSFAAGIRHELHGCGVTITTLLPGPVETGFFARAGMSDTRLGSMLKEPPELVARQAVRGLLRGRPTVIGGRLISVPAAVALALLPRAARARLQALLSKPRRGTYVWAKRRRARAVSAA